MLGAAVIGTGQPGLYHAEAYRRRPDVELRAVWSRREARARQVGDHFGAAVCTSDLDAILGDDGIDLVSICTPNHLHVEPALRALRAGKHVFIEAPMVSRGVKADALVAAAEETGRKVYVGQIDRVEPAFRAIKKLADEGDLGAPFLLESTFISSGWTGGKPADWWGRDPRNPEIVLVSFGCFPVSLLRWVAGPIVEVQAYGRLAGPADLPHHDTVIANLRFESGALGRMVITERAQRPYSIDLAVYGDRGTAINNRLYLSKLRGLAREEFIELPIPLIEWRAYPDETIQSLFSAEIEEFVGCVRDDTPPAVDAREGAAIIKTLEAMARSLQSGAAVRI